MNNYYVYIYLDPRKLGQYHYSDICLLYEPFYVGKGKNDRYKIYIRRNNSLKNKINKIKQSGLEPIILKLYENLSEEQSFNFEKKLICQIGRKDLNCGTLLNFTDGGEGTSGYIFPRKIIDDIHEKQMKEFHNIKKEFKKRNYKLLSTEEEYKNEYTKLKYICNKGHICHIRWNDFQQKHGCLTCINELRSKSFRGEKNPQSILIIQDIVQIKLLLKEGKLTQANIGEIFGIAHQTVSKIKNKKLWSHIEI